MKHSTLVILAAGLGSRFGGSKQITEAGPSGQCLMEYSLFDAVEAGFDHVVFILKADMVETVKRMLGDRLEKRVRVDYAVQDFSSLPDFYSVPKERVKPFGTVHAVLCAAPYIDSHFATVNADDYYGKDVYRILQRQLASLKDESEAAMVPYVLGNTMSPNGGVTRGVCRVESGRLCAVEETRSIRYENGGIVGESGALQPDAWVSMNVWGFHRDFLPCMQTYFEHFLRTLPENEQRAECLLPIMVNDFLKCGRLTVSAECSRDTWFGLTYREDLAEARDRLQELHSLGAYPAQMF